VNGEKNSASTRANQTSEAGAEGGKVVGRRGRRELALDDWLKAAGRDRLALLYGELRL